MLNAYWNGNGTPFRTIGSQPTRSRTRGRRETMLSSRKNKRWRERFVDRRLVPQYIIVFQLDTIQAKVKVEAQVVDTKTKELLEDWATKKPIGVRIECEILHERYGLLLVGRFETTRCHPSTGTLRNQAQRTVGEASSAQQGQAERENARTRQAILYQNRFFHISMIPLFRSHR